MKKQKYQIKKIQINSKSRPLSANWTVKSQIFIDDNIVKSDSSEPEIWTILKTPPKPKWSLEDELSDALAKEITAAIDKEILDAMRNEIKKSKIK